MPVIKVFLSSTARDLHEHREAVYRAIEALDDCHCVRMEDFGARDREADDFCRAKVAECDLFLGVIGHLYGSCPPGKTQSFTELEYDAAVENNKPRLIFLAPEDFPLPANLIEPDDKRQKQRAFRERVSAERMRDTFSSPQDLATRAVVAIRNWEREQALVQAHPSARPEGIMPLPPQPYFAHPYALQQNFTGRVGERGELTEWFTHDEHPLFAYIAIGGMGKSAVTWAWLQRDVLGLPLPGVAAEPPGVCDRCRIPEAARPEGVLWWSFYERESTFQKFLDEALIYCSSATIDPKAIAPIHDKLEALYNVLCQHRFLVVLDGVERILRAYASLDAAYRGDRFEEDPRDDFRSCTDPHAGTFLQWLAWGAMKSKVLLTSRLLPRELDGLTGCRGVSLTAFDPDDAVDFFHAQGVSKGTRAEIQDACSPYGYLPLGLRLLSGLIVRDKRHPGDIKVAKRYPVLPELKGKEQHHILEVAYNALNAEKRKLLSSIAAFRSPMTYEALSVLNPYESKAEFDAALEELIQRGMLLFDRQSGRYDLHPIVRQYAYDRLADKAGVHTRLRDYFAAIPAPDEDKVQSLEDLAPVIELYHHAVRAGRYDEAGDLLYKQLHRPLYFRFGAYQTAIELLRALFPDGEDKPPRLERQDAQAWTAAALANSYSLSGQPRRAIPLFEIQITIRQREGDKKNVAIGLENIALTQLHLGELAEAEQSLLHSIKLSREEGEKQVEAMGRSELSRLLAYRGAFGEAAQELDQALTSLTKPGDAQGRCIVFAYRAECALLLRDWKPALAAARQAFELWKKCVGEKRAAERDRIEAEWLQGAAQVALAAEKGQKPTEDLLEAEGHLTEALTRCRRINLVELEPDILLSWARWHYAKGDAAQARQCAEEALTIADRCEYRLKQADIHNCLARMALDAGDREEAKKHAEIARERAWCDGPPHCYKPALDQAERLLKQLGPR